MYLSQVVPGSLAIVNSPATSVLNHQHRFTRVSQYLNAAFCTHSLEDENHVLQNRVKSDLREGFNLNSGSLNYCQGDNLKCARYMVAKKLGKEKVPQDLYPNMVEKAKKLMLEDHSLERMAV